MTIDMTSNTSATISDTPRILENKTEIEHAEAMETADQAISIKVDGGESGTEIEPKVGLQVTYSEAID